jgi:outer membrane protein OmpA-like peptidoglycan-associated protein
MSNANPAPPAQSTPEPKPESTLQQKSRLAVGFLILMFASGILLVYLVDAMQPMTAISQEDTDAGMTAPNAAESTVAADAYTPEPAPVPDPRLAEETQTMRELLAVTQQQMQSMANDLKALKDRQTLTETNAPVLAKDASLVQLKPDYADLNAQSTDDGMLVSLTESDLNFPKGGAALPSKRPASLEKVAEFLDRHRNLLVLLQGHTDSLGNAARNLALSEQRAIAVKAALVDLGIAQDRIRTEGMGETKPIASNDTAQGRSRNRRVDLYLTER